MAPSYTGSCKCGAIQIALEGEPQIVGLCHCLNCRKSTSSAFSSNAIFPITAFSLIQGEAKVYEQQGGSGHPAYVNFCANCGSMMFTKSSLMTEIIVIKMGILDGDAMDKLKPNLETFTSRKPCWVESLEGARQLEEGFRPAPPAEGAKS